MNPIESNNTPKPSAQPSARTGQNLKPARASSRLLSVVHNKDERSLHLSPILQQIKDDGPALIDGEVVKEAGVAAKLAKPANDPKAAVPVVATAPQSLLADKHVRFLLGFCAALTLGLCASLYVSWQQQQRLANVEYLLEVLVTSPR